MKGNFQVRCGAGEKMEIISKSYLSLYIDIIIKKCNYKNINQ